MTDGTVLLLAGLVGGGVGLWLRVHLSALTYRSSAEADRPAPGARWWVPAACAGVTFALVWRILVAPHSAVLEAAATTDWRVQAADIVVLGVVVVTGWVGVWLAAIDLDVHRLPDRITGPTLIWVVVGLAAAAALNGDWAAWLGMLGYALGCGLLYLMLALLTVRRGSSGLGLGDVKLSIVLGAALGWFGFETVLVGMYVGFLVGGLVAVVLVVARRVNLRGHLAFGPAMLVGALCGVLIAPDVVSSMF